MPDLDHHEIACEQLVWWRQRVTTMREMLLAVGHPAPPPDPTSEYVVGTSPGRISYYKKPV
jgi:hypothetical protein